LARKASPRSIVAETGGLSRNSCAEARPTRRTTTSATTQRRSNKPDAPGLSIETPRSISIRTMIHLFGWFNNTRKPPCLPGSPWRPLLFPLRFLDQPVQGGIDGLRAGTADPLVPDHALGIDHVKGRRAGQVPLGRDGTLAQLARVRKGSPGQLLLFHRLLELLDVVAVDVDADQGEGLVFQLLDERPLVGPLGPSGESLLMPEVEQHHLAPVVAELEALAVLILAFDLRGLLADAQVADLK